MIFFVFPFYFLYFLDAIQLITTHNHPLTCKHNGVVYCFFFWHLGWLPHHNHGYHPHVHPTVMMMNGLQHHTLRRQVTIIKPFSLLFSQLSFYTNGLFQMLFDNYNIPPTTIPSCLQTHGVTLKTAAAVQHHNGHHYQHDRQERMAQGMHHTMRNP